MNIGCGMAMIRAIGVVVATALLSLALVAPALGGTLCSLQATVGGGSATEVETGEEVLIEGFDFPADQDVFVTYLVDAAVIGSETVHTDATGFFETTVIPQPGEEGLWTVEAESPKQCTATTGFLVVAAAATPSPSPSPSPTPAPTPVQGELPDVAANEPGPPMALVQGAALLLAAAIWLLRRPLARLVR